MNDKLSENNLNFLSIISLFTIISIAIGIITLSIASAIVNLIMGIITSYIIYKGYRKSANIYIIIYILSVIFMFSVYFVNFSTFDTPYYNGGSDDLSFEKYGNLVYESAIYNPDKLLELNILDWTNNAPLFASYLASLIRFSNIFDGYSTFIPRIMNVYFLLWICLCLDYLLQKYSDMPYKARIISLLLFSLTPNIQFINSHVFRDSLNLLQILLIVILIDKLFSKNNLLFNIFHILSLLLVIYSAFYTRTNSLVFATGISLTLLVFKFDIKKRFILVLFPFLIFAKDFTELIRLDYFIKEYSSYVLMIAGDGLSRVIFEQTILPFGIFLRAAYAFVTPFPNIFGIFKDLNFLIYDSLMVLIYIGVFIQVMLLPFILIRLFKFDWLTITFIITFIGVISTTFTFRHVMLYFPFMIALGIDGFFGLNQRRRQYLIVINLFLLFCFSMIYILIKVL